MIPRTIWMLWLQGWEEAPPIICAAYRSWQRYNPGWTVRALAAADVVALLPDDEAVAVLPKGWVEPEVRANMIRMGLLRRYGGVWADATTLCLRPLDDWIEAAAPAGFFAFDRPFPDRMISNWFLAAVPRSHIVDEWHRRCIAYWRGREARHAYSWHHYLFADAYREDPRFRDLWDITPRISADGPHRFVPYDRELARPFTDEDRTALERTSLLKLTHKLPPGVERAGSVYRTLLEIGA